MAVQVGSSTSSSTSTNTNTDTRDVRIEVLHRIIDEAIVLGVNNIPYLKRGAVEVMELIFATKTVCRQLLVLILLETTAVTVQHCSAIVTSILATTFSSKSRLIRSLREQQQDTVQTQDEWMDIAERIDHIQGNDIWRSCDDSPLYEPQRITGRIEEFVHLMRKHDIFELMFLLRGGIGRNKFGLLHEGLFTKALAGTKVLIETYHNVVCAALDYVCDAPSAMAITASTSSSTTAGSIREGDDEWQQQQQQHQLQQQQMMSTCIPSEAKLAFFNETRHSYGRTALLLSGGAALGFYHVGVVKTLMENRLMPRVLGGSSAGSIVCAMVGTRTDLECTRDLFAIQGTNAPGHSGSLKYNFFRPLHLPTLSGNNHNNTNNNNTELEEVYTNTAGFFHDMKRTLQAVLIPIPLRAVTSLLFDICTFKTRPQDLLMSDTEHFRECIRINVGDFTFQEAFDRTGRILNITVTPINSSDPPRLLNYLTAPHVLVWSAVVASSSLPGVFESNRLMVKDADGTVRYESAEWNCDGSMEQDLPMQQLSEMFNVNHFIVSQANPHAVMFGSYSHSTSIWSGPLLGLVNSIVGFLKNQCRSWLSHVVEMVGARRFAPQHATSRQIGAQFFVQEYEGRDCDISLIPWLGHRGMFSALLHALYNPSEAEFREWIEAAQRETWKYVPTIKSHVAEEITLDQCVQRLRKRIVAESIEKRRQHSRTSSIMNAKMDVGVPDFFVSPSLVNFGGLGIADQCVVEDMMHNTLSSSSSSRDKLHGRCSSPFTTKPILQGWAGLGLHGNKSAGSLESHASGLFIDEGDEQHNFSKEQQIPGQEATTHVPIHLLALRHSSSSSSKRQGIMNDVHAHQDDDESKKQQQCFKTTNMANFYYRNSLPRSRSHEDHMKDDDEVSFFQGQKKSQSHTTLASSSYAALDPLDEEENGDSNTNNNNSSNNNPKDYYRVPSGRSSSTLNST